MKKFPFTEKSVEELIEEANTALKSNKYMSDEEQLEDDAQYGYFQDDEG